MRYLFYPTMFCPNCKKIKDPCMGETWQIQAVIVSVLFGLSSNKLTSSVCSLCACVSKKKQFIQEQLWVEKGGAQTNTAKVLKYFAPVVFFSEQLCNFPETFQGFIKKITNVFHTSIVPVHDVALLEDMVFSKMHYQFIRHPRSQGCVLQNLNAHGSICLHSLL